MDQLSFVDSGRGDDSHFVIVGGVKQPFLAYGNRKVAPRKHGSHVVCMVKKKVGADWLYSICFDGRTPPADDWFSKRVEVVRLNGGGVRCRIGNQRFVFEWPAEYL